MGDLGYVCYSRTCTLESHTPPPLPSQATDQLGKVKEISHNIEEESDVSKKTRVHHNKVLEILICRYVIKGHVQDWALESESAFGDYLRDLAESSRQSLM